MKTGRHFAQDLQRMLPLGRLDIHGARSLVVFDEPLKFRLLFEVVIQPCAGWLSACACR